MNQHSALRTLYDARCYLLATRDVSKDLAAAWAYHILICCYLQLYPLPKKGKFL